MATKDAVYKNEATVIVDKLLEYKQKFYKYKYYIVFKLGNDRFEYLTNDPKLFESLEENHMYSISYIPIPLKIIAPKTAAIHIQWSKVKCINNIN